MAGRNLGSTADMVKLGYFLSSEEFDAPELVRQAKLAEEHGFEALWISDHFHPWLAEQGNSPFVWSVIGAISQVCSLPITTAVTCPTIRIHPAIVAQAAATSAILTGGKFILGVGSGEALNEHIFGDAWPSADVRLEMLEEAVEVIRLLWQGGQQSHRGRHYTVDTATLFSLPEELPPILISGFGPKAVSLAARIGDGYVNVGPDAELLEQYRAEGGKGVAQGGMKVCWAESEEEAVRTVHERWPNEGLPGELPQVLPTVNHFEQASSLVTPEMAVEGTPCGPDPEQHVAQIRKFLDAGYDEVYVSQIGDDQEGFLSFYEREVLPQF